MFRRIALVLLLTISAEAASAFDSQIPREIEQVVDLIELNHFHDDKGRNAYDQLIFYRWSPDYRRFDVMAWLLVDGERKNLPTKNHNRGEYVVRWRDAGYGVDRVVRSQAFRETWTSKDPERAHKKLMDENLRVGFARKLEWK